MSAKETNCLLTDAEVWRRSENPREQEDGKYSSVIEHLSSKHGALALILRTHITATEATSEKDPSQDFYPYRFVYSHKVSTGSGIRMQRGLCPAVNQAVLSATPHSLPSYSA